MAPTIAKLSTDEGKEVTRLGRHNARAEADTWRTFIVGDVFGSGTGFASIRRDGIELLHATIGAETGANTASDNNVTLTIRDPLSGKVHRTDATELCYLLNHAALYLGDGKVASAQSMTRDDHRVRAWDAAWDESREERPTSQREKQAESAGMVVDISELSLPFTTDDGPEPHYPDGDA